jgi:hypothetical protein
MWLLQHEGNRRLFWSALSAYQPHDNGEGKRQDLTACSGSPLGCAAIALRYAHMSAAVSVDPERIWGQCVSCYHAVNDFIDSTGGFHG